MSHNIKCPKCGNEFDIVANKCTQCEFVASKQLCEIAAKKVKENKKAEKIVMYFPYTKVAMLVGVLLLCCAIGIDMDPLVSILIITVSILLIVCGFVARIACLSYISKLNKTKGDK